MKPKTTTKPLAKQARVAVAKNGRRVYVPKHSKQRKK